MADGLEAAGHEVERVLIERDGRWLSAGEPLTLEPANGLLGCDVAFPVLHGPFGEDGTVQGLLECLDVAYVGPNVLSAAVALDKLVFKRLLSFHGLPQVDFCDASEEGWRERAEGLGLPLWVKPSRLGSSVGITRVESLDQLDAAVEEARSYDPRVIVEAHAEGKEVECSVIGNEQPETSMPGEIVTRGEWYDFESKYGEGGMELIVPAPIGDEPWQESASSPRPPTARSPTPGSRAATSSSPMPGEVLVNELNTIPGFTATSVFGTLWEASGLAYPDLCDRLVAFALERYESERSHRF